MVENQMLETRLREWHDQQQKLEHWEELFNIENSTFTKKTKMQTYNVLEASELLDISTRAVQKRCFLNKVRKKSNRYLITEEHIEKWRAEIKANEPTNEPVRELEELGTRIAELEAIIVDLRSELKQYDISDNQRIEVFTNDEYHLLETRLREWTNQQQKLEQQEQLFNVEKLGLKELLEHYKNQFEYQKKQSEKILEMHQTLIDTIQKQSTLALQRNIIEAREKDVINKDWTKKD